MLLISLLLAFLRLARYKDALFSLNKSFTFFATILAAKLRNIRIHLASIVELVRIIDVWSVPRRSLSRWSLGDTVYWN